MILVKNGGNRNTRNEVMSLNPFLNIKDTNADNFFANLGRMRGCLHKVVGLVSPFKCNVGFSSTSPIHIMQRCKYRNRYYFHRSRNLSETLKEGACSKVQEWKITELQIKAELLFRRVFPSLTSDVKTVLILIERI